MKFLRHLFAVYASLVASFIALGLLILLIPPLGRVTNPFGRILDAPLFPIQIVSAFFVGGFFYKKMPSRWSFAIWIVPLAFLLYSVWSYLPMSKYDSVWNTYFGAGCGGSECLYELTVTAPFYASI